MKIIIYICLIIAALAKISEIEFGKEIPFDINNNEFELTFNEKGALLVAVNFGVSDILNVNMSFKGYNFKNIVKAPGYGIIIPFSPGETNIIKLEYLSPSEEKGTILIQPTTKEIAVNLDQVYEWKYSIQALFFNTEPFVLTYSINNAEKDAILKFNYDNNMKVEDKEITNPMRLCHGDTCQSNLTSYNIKKGESYKILIEINVFKKGKNFGPVLYTYYLPSFSFSFATPEEGKQPEKQEGLYNEGEKEKEKQDEEVKKQEEETKKQEEEVKKQEEEGKKLEEETKKQEEEIKKQEEDTKKQEERRKQEEKRKHEEKRKQEERRKQEQKKKQEQQKKQKKKGKKLVSQVESIGESNDEEIEDTDEIYNRLSIFLVISNIILIGVLGFSCFLLYRKRAKSKIEAEKKASGGIKFELKEIKNTKYVEENSEA